MYVALGTTIVAPASCQRMYHSGVYSRNCLLPLSNAPRHRRLVQPTGGTHADICSAARISGNSRRVFTYCVIVRVQTTHNELLSCKRSLRNSWPEMQPSVNKNLRSSEDTPRGKWFFFARSLFHRLGCLRGREFSTRVDVKKARRACGYPLNLLLGRVERVQMCVPVSLLSGMYGPFPPVSATKENGMRSRGGLPHSWNVPKKTSRDHEAPWGWHVCSYRTRTSDRFMIVCCSLVTEFGRVSRHRLQSCNSKFAKHVFYSIQSHSVVMNGSDFFREPCLRCFNCTRRNKGVSHCRRLSKGNGQDKRREHGYLSSHVNMQRKSLYSNPIQGIGHPSVASWHPCILSTRNYI